MIVRGGNAGRGRSAHEQKSARMIDRNHPNPVPRMPPKEPFHFQGGPDYSPPNRDGEGRGARRQMARRITRSSTSKERTNRRVRTRSRDQRMGLTEEAARGPILVRPLQEARVDGAALGRGPRMSPDRRPAPDQVRRSICQTLRLRGTAMAPRLFTRGETQGLWSPRSAPATTNSSLDAASTAGTSRTSCCTQLPPPYSVGEAGRVGLR